MTIVLFAGLTDPSTASLDENLTLVSNQAPIPCSVSGTNAITLTQKADTYAVTAYTNNMQLTGVAAGSNSTAMTARLGALSALNVYKDTGSGPAALVGGELIAGNAFTLLYDATLTTGAGGWHLFSSTGLSTTAINPSTIQLGSGQVLNRYLTRTVSVSFSVFDPFSSQQSIIALAGVGVNDAVQVGPPSMTNAMLSFVGFVPASGSVTLRGLNGGSTSVTLAAGLFRVTGMG